jgi:hypothetical protein
MSGGSWAPIENSPPGIQAIPDGASPGDAALFGTVGRKCDPPVASTEAVFDFDSGEGAVEEGTGADAAWVRESLANVPPAIAMAIAIATPFRRALFF